MKAPASLKFDGTMNFVPSFSLDELEVAKDSWKRKRRGRFTASDMHQLFTSKLEESTGKTALGYIVEKVTEVTLTDDEFDNLPNLDVAAMNWGNMHEPYAVELYEKTTHNQVFSAKRLDTDEQEFFEVKGFDAGATPDGLVGDDGILEIKCPYKPSNHSFILLNNTASDIKKNRHEYYIQMQTALWATGRKWCDFVSFDPRFAPKKQIVIVRIERDNDFIKLLETVVRKAEAKKKAFVELLSD